MQDADIAKNPSNFLKYPLIKQWTYHIRGKRYRIRVYDQPGRWMTDDQLESLKGQLSEIAARSMEDVPTYGVFSGQRSSFVNRVVGVVTVARTDEPVAFTALVYLPITLNGQVHPVLHLGLTMIKKRFRGHRLQGPLFEKLFFTPSLNQLRNDWILTNIAASPAGIGSVADYFEDAYPHYRGTNERRAYHLTVAEKLLRYYRHEFGCAETAVFDPETFVVKGSNDPRGGGAYQFIREDPVSRHKQEECNSFCNERLRYAEGDELFQVARLNMIRGIVGILRRIGVRKRAAAQVERASIPAMGGK